MAPVEQHTVVAADGVRIGVHRLGTGRGPAILLMAGTFSSRLFWLGSRAQGFGYALADAGFDPWIVEPRGRGASDRPGSWTMDDWIRFDAPAAMEAVLGARGEGKVLWVGHSAGGVVGAGFAGSGSRLAERLAGMVLLGSPGPGGISSLRRAGAGLVYLMAAALPRAHWHGGRLGLGPESEPAPLIRDWMRWNLIGRWTGANGRDYLEGLREARLPVLAVAGAGDRALAPPPAVQDLLGRFGSEDRTFLVAGRSHGFSTDFDHPGLVIGRRAREEIWPRVIDWIATRARTAGLLVGN